LLNLTETPFFVVDLGEVDHVHFERVNYTSKAFDLVLVNRDFSKQPWRVDMIPNADKDTVQEWLTDMELTYTEGPMNLNWKQIMNTVNDDDRFYLDTEEDEVTEKDAGWEFLRMFGKDDDDDNDVDEDDSEFSEAKGHSEEPSDDESEVEDLESEDDDDDFDGDEDLEEQGMDWDEMEEEAAISDKKKRAMGDDDVELARKPRRGNSEQPKKRGNSEQPKKKRRH
jgi:nucleosome binding factor SPN SPT16 subunit